MKPQSSDPHRNYVLDRETACFRTQVALRLSIMPDFRWLRFIDGEDDGREQEEEFEAIFAAKLRTFKVQATKTLEAVRRKDLGLAGRAMLEARWLQVLTILELHTRSLAAGR